jgi:hypothetical protein
MGAIFVKEDDTTGIDIINPFNPATFSVLIPSQDLDFQRHMSWSFVDTVGIDNHHCFNVLFIIHIQR